MISSYEIKKENSEEVLYLYLDLNNEFGKINLKKEQEKIENIIKEFIRENKIVFTGTTVALVIGSTIIGNVLLNNDKKVISNENDVAIEEVVPLNTIEIKEEIFEKNEEERNEVEKVGMIESEKEEIKEKDNSTKTVNTTTDVVKNETTSDNINTNTETQKTETMPQEENNIYIKVKRNNGDIITIELEEYIVGVVGAEMPASFQNQALMAQAVIARTYALKANSKGQTLTDNESTQSYKTNDELKTMWGSSYNTYYNKIKNAVKSTEGTYLTYSGTYIEAVYHSTSNGQTEDSSNVWGNYFPYLVSVDSTYDSLNPTFIQDKTITYEELSSKLNDDININTSFNIISKTTGNRVDVIEINGKSYKGTSLRNLLGLRSADFDITKIDTGITFTTRGYGHGVGMSQYGANGMAKNGYSYIDILKHYYSGVTISHL